MLTRRPTSPIDTAAVMPDGTHLSGPEDLHAALASRGPLLAQSITDKLMEYAVGRPLNYDDMPGVRRIVHEAADDNYRFEAIVRGIVNSDAFRKACTRSLADVAHDAGGQLEFRALDLET